MALPPAKHGALRHKEPGLDEGIKKKVNLKVDLSSYS